LVRINHRLAGILHFLAPRNRFLGGKTLWSDPTNGFLLKSIHFFVPICDLLLPENDFCEPKLAIPF